MFGLMRYIAAKIVEAQAEEAKRRRQLEELNNAYSTALTVNKKTIDQQERELATLRDKLRITETKRRELEKLDLRDVDYSPLERQVLSNLSMEMLREPRTYAEKVDRTCVMYGGKPTTPYGHLMRGLIDMAYRMALTYTDKDKAFITEVGVSKNEWSHRTVTGTFTMAAPPDNIPKKRRYTVDSSLSTQWIYVYEDKPKRSGHLARFNYGAEGYAMACQYVDFLNSLE